MVDTIITGVVRDADAKIVHVQITQIFEVRMMGRRDDDLVVGRCVGWNKSHFPGSKPKIGDKVRIARSIDAIRVQSDARYWHGTILKHQRKLDWTKVGF